jgi:subtilase family serine protease
MSLASWFRSPRAGYSRKGSVKARRRRLTLFVEQLEDRTVPQASSVSQTLPVALDVVQPNTPTKSEPPPKQSASSTSTSGVAQPQYTFFTQENVKPNGKPGQSPPPSTGGGPAGGYTPDQMRTAYGDYGITDPLTGSAFGNDATYNSDAGKGQTIAIVDAYNDPTITSDLATFDNQYNLPAPPSFTVENQTGSAGPLPATNNNWAGEIALDVEWAHAIAPAANIVLVEANSTSLNDLLTAVNTAVNNTVNPSLDAQVVSMSWGGSEFSTETSYDSTFNKAGVTFVASAGDYGPPPLWPAISPNVVSVGGTSLNLSSSGAYQSESGWGDGRLTRFYGGSGGGISKYETQPSYQKGVVPQTSTARTGPDVAYDANPNTGVSVYLQTGGYNWVEAGGTSIGAPEWAALFAIADQTRVAEGKGTLTSTQALTALYAADAHNNYNSTTYTSTFHDITSGNNGYSALHGYDLVTGLGSPESPTVIATLGKA